MKLTTQQLEILGWMADGWELLRWKCNDGSHRWHAGEDEVDGRAVRGLWTRGMVEIKPSNHPELVLTPAGREALAAGTARRDGRGG